jgi:hypothetical protein
MTQLRQFEIDSPVISLSFRLNSEAQRHFVSAVKNLKQVVESQATKIASYLDKEPSALVSQ